MNLCDDECPYLSLTEKEQNSIHKLGKSREYHFCNKYEKQVFHGPYHPEIIAVKECKYSIKKETENVRRKHQV